MYTISLKQSVIIIKTNETIANAIVSWIFIRTEGHVYTEINKGTKPCSNIATKACR